MPRPTAAQFAYGALTVVLATTAMLLLSPARSGTGVVLVAAAALALGLLVSLSVARTDAAPASTAHRGTAGDRRPPDHAYGEAASRPGTEARTPASLRR